MTSSSDRGAPPRSPHARFIPREEVQSFAAFRLGALGGTAPQAAAAPPAPEAQRAALKAARDQGYQDGYRDGLAALEAFKQSFAQQATSQVGALLASFDAQLEALELRLAAGLAQAATALARQVVRSELATRPELVAGVAVEALDALLLGARHVSVHVHPDDLPLVAQGAADELERRGARLVPSAQVARGGCVVESDLGHVDAGIELRWTRAAAALGDDAPLGRGDEGAALVLRGEAAP